MSQKSASKPTPKSNNGNTLFKYFAKSPASEPKVKKPEPAEKPVISAKRSIDADEDDEEIQVVKRRRKIILDDSSDSETEQENKEPNQVQQMSESVTGLANFEFGNISTVTLNESMAISPPPKKKAKKTPHAEEEVRWEHEKVEFLKPDQIRDINKRRRDHPEYDPRTLYVPESYLNTLTPAMRQWWELKSQHFDCIIFFKVGKFYELYHMDASVGVKELKFCYMKGNFAHSGFPEQAYDKMATQLVELGYKVARVEQTETPDMMQERVKNTKKPTKFDKVSRREICQVSELGTQVFTQQTVITEKPEARLLFAINELGDRYGVCFVDTSICDFFYGEFDDDRHSSRLRTLLAHYSPVLVLHERNGLSARTQTVFKTMLRNCKKEPLSKNSQMLTAEKTLKELKEKYFNANEGKKFPPALAKLQHPDDPLGLTPAPNADLVLRSLGGIMWYLQNAFLDQQVLDTARFSGYTPPDQSQHTQLQRRHMVLDAITLHNLRGVGEEFSLFKTLDYCCTKFGKRLLHTWICSPSAERAIILDRQRAVSELYERTDVLQDIRLIFSKLQDMERLLAIVHGFGNRKQGHPDTRAILYEMPTYNKKKINDFVATLNGFELLLRIPEVVKKCSSELLRKVTHTEAEGGEFPEMKEILDYFKDTFDFESAQKTGALAPQQGDDADFDAIEESIADLETELKVYLKEQEKYFGCKVAYFGSEKKRYQIEVPDSAAKKAGNKYQLESQKKGKQPAKRYHTTETKDFLKRMFNLEDQRKAVMGDFARRIFEKFSKHFDLWKKCVSLMTELDVLCSLAEYARNQQTICVPEIIDSNEPALNLTDSVHPCMAQNSDFIPNDIALGHNGKSPLALLTGPNMGGKSTIMRQVGLIQIMVQLGAMIPAASCQTTIVDRIFTRLGAQDDIISGQSTFLVELCETSAILKHATAQSLVLLDELGRGTSTYDGNAIAGAVVNYLADRKCRCLFSTHYHNLVDNFKEDTRIALGHMACMVENEDSNDPTQETVTFLYKYVDGPCPKSYGFNAAKLAGMPQTIIRRAYELSKKVEAIALKRKLLCKIMNGTDKSEIQECISKLKACSV